jgi:hypothetical protein
MRWRSLSDTTEAHQIPTIRTTAMPPSATDDLHLTEKRTKTLLTLFGAGL